MPRFFLFALGGILVSTAVAQDSPRNDRQLRQALSEIVEVDTLANALVAVKVVRAESGETLFAHNEQKTLMPASNAKLYTTAVALDQLGPDFSYTTNLFAERDAVTEGVLESNLVVMGSGDPVIGGRYNDGDITAVFRAWADSLKAAGIRRIEGDIIGDDNLFDDLQLGYGWSWDDEPWWYSAEISALSLNDNVVDFTLEPGTLGGAGHLSWTPLNTSYVDVRNASITVDSTEGLDEGYTRVRDGNQMVVSTEVPLGYTETESISIHNPTLYFVHVLRDVLVSEGIAVTGRGVDVDDLSIAPNYHHAVRLASHTSPPLRQIADAINKPSHNLYAELVLKTLGVVLPGHVRGCESRLGRSRLGSRDADPGRGRSRYVADQARGRLRSIAYESGQPGDDDRPVVLHADSPGHVCVERVLRLSADCRSRRNAGISDARHVGRRQRTRQDRHADRGVRFERLCDLRRRF